MFYIRLSLYVVYAWCLFLVSLNAAYPADGENKTPADREVIIDSPFSVSYKLSNTDKLNAENTAASEYFAPGGNITSQQLTQLPEDDNNALLLEVGVGSIHFDNLLQAFQVGNTIFIPLGYFSSIIDLAVTTDPAKGIAQGFIFKEQRTFYLDANRGEVTISGVRKHVDPSRMAIRELDDIYVDINLISEWFPMKLKVDLYAARVEIKPDEPLPFQQRRMREQRMKRARASIPVDRGYPMQTDPYKQWSYPFINQTAQAGVFKNANGDISSTFSYATYATADLMKMESTWYLAGSKGNLFDDYRVTFGRKNPDATLLGPLKAREYSFGHINEPIFNLVTSPTTIQPGITFSNYPLTRQLQFDSHNFHGDLPPGWAVELYRNNALLNYQATAVNGQYQFDNIPLLFGHNHFRLVFYGPQGQQREESYTFELNQSLTQDGEQYYRAFVSDDEHFGARTILQYDAGINKSLSVTANFASIPIDKTKLILGTEENHNYLDMGIRGFHKSLFYKADYTNDMQSGSALNWNVQTQLRGVILSLGETYFNGMFISEEFPESTQYIERRTQARLDAAIPNRYFSYIPLTLELARDQLHGNISSNRITNRLSVTKHRLAASNTLSLVSQTGLDSSLTGALQVNQQMPRYNIRGSLAYQLRPVGELSSTSITVDGFKLWAYHAAIGYNHIVMSDIDQVFFNLTKPVGAYSLGLSNSYSTGGVISVNLTFQMGIGRKPRSGNWITEYRPIADYGSLSVRTFLDENSNGKFDATDQGLKDVKIRINGGEVSRQSDAQGVIYLVGLEPYRDTDVDVAVETLDDPLWQPGIKGKRVRLRPGYTNMIDLPVVYTGEIDGTVYLQDGDTKRAVSNVDLELVNLEGKVIQKVKSEYDGFYLFTKIPLAKYIVRVSKKQLNKLGLETGEPKAISLKKDNLVVNGIDINLEKVSARKITSVKSSGLVHHQDSEIQKLVQQKHGIKSTKAEQGPTK